LKLFCLQMDTPKPPPGAYQFTDCVRDLEWNKLEGELTREANCYGRFDFPSELTDAERDSPEAKEAERIIDAFVRSNWRGQEA